ncbi:MAG TPA: zf-HC2 domain-containing protein, partial [Ornithinibacter sp.]|nr:zf-HC2 domain-containing protein [Ornithinibacter sp.]
MSPDLHHLSGAYAVDALDDAERASFEQHLALCADCRAEVAELSATAHSLASLAEATPPPSLRASVLSDIARVRPLPPLTQDAGAPAPAAAVPSTPPAAQVSSVGPDSAEPDDVSTVVPLRRRPRTA